MTYKKGLMKQYLVSIFYAATVAALFVLGQAAGNIFFLTALAGFVGICIEIYLLQCFFRRSLKGYEFAANTTIIILCGLAVFYFFIRYAPLHC